MDLRKLFDCMISVSDLGRGQASKVLQTVEETGNPYIIVKNNKPQAVILSIDNYAELLKAQEVLNSLDLPENKLPPSRPGLYDSSLSEEEMRFFLHEGAEELND